MKATPSAEPPWPAGPQTPVLRSNQVDVWRVDLAPDADQLQRDRAMLGPEEETQAQRYRFDMHRHRFIARRAARRRILGRYLHVPGSELRFVTKLHGKPHLADATEVSFNTSHSASMALIAVGKQRDLGIDVESLDRVVEPDRLAHRFFAPAEAEVITQLKGEDARVAFFTCWTRKEAYVKARGKGLAMGLKTFEVSIDPPEPAELRRTDDDPQNRTRWTMWHLVPDAGYLGALASNGRPTEPRRWRFTLE